MTVTFEQTTTNTGVHEGEWQDFRQFIANERREQTYELSELLLDVAVLQTEAVPDYRLIANMLGQAADLARAIAGRPTRRGTGVRSADLIAPPQFLS